MVGEFRFGFFFDRRGEEGGGLQPSKAHAHDADPARAKPHQGPSIEPRQLPDQD